MTRDPYQQHNTPDTRESCNCCGALCEPDVMPEGDDVCPACMEGVDYTPRGPLPGAAPAAPAPADTECCLMALIDARVARYGRYLTGARHGTEARQNVERKLAAAIQARRELAALVEAGRHAREALAESGSDPLTLGKLTRALAPFPREKAGGR